jgi:Ca2+-binding RTX toxin-like protein
MNAGCVCRGSLRLAEVPPPRSRCSTFARRAVLATATLATLAFAAPASAFTETFNYTGTAQTWTVPAGVTQATFDLYGAQGAGIASVDEAGGLGGRATATIPVTPGASIQVNVGGQGLNETGGFNGGGGAISGGAGGGGASDIRIGGTALTDRVLVAGGGGGAGVDFCTGDGAAGGGGGGLTGSPGSGTECEGGVGGGGGTQTAGGSAAGGGAQAGAFGVGGSADQASGLIGGGGGGWYGGGGGVRSTVGGPGGGGGSGHGPDGTSFQTGVRSGNGLVTVSYTPTIDTLIERVEELNLPPNLQKSLLQKLNTAKQNPAQACQELAAFISQVQHQSGNQISGRDADQLSEQTLEVRESKGCDAALGGCAGRKATVVGSGRADVLRGTKGDDVIAAGRGDDTVVGLGGDDLVCGGAGADLIQGQGGDDSLRGGRGKDELRGGGGSNRCRGGGGSDSKHQC